MKKKPTLLFRSRSDADERFYDGYDPSFLLNKATLLFTSCEHPDELRAFVIATGGNPEEVDAAVLRSFVAELHSTVLHQFEALFALILAEFQPLPHWIFLTEYRTDDLKKKAQQLIRRDYRALSGGSCDMLAEFVARAVYPGVVAPEEIQASWDEGVADIGWLIEEGAKRYLSSPEYNAYKHGLRVLPGAATLMIRAGSPSDFKPLISMASSLTYLERESTDDGVQFAEVTKEIKAADAYEWIFAMASLAEMVKNFRLAGLRREPIKIPTVRIDRRGLSRLKPVSSFRFPL